MAISKARQLAALAKLTPAANRWLLAEIAKARSTPSFNAQQAQDDIRRAPSGLSEDVEAAVFIVMQSAANDMDNDVRQILCADSSC